MEKKKKRRKERVGPVAANQDNLESNKEEGGGHKVLGASSKHWVKGLRRIGGGD